MESQEQTPDKFATVCTKCDINFDGKLALCPSCGNRAYLKVLRRPYNSVVLTKDNKEILEAHCRTIFPDDVVFVVPSMIASMVGAEEVLEKARIARERAEKRTRKKPRKKPSRSS